jgi:hypothetical protein
MQEFARWPLDGQIGFIASILGVICLLGGQFVDRAEAGQAGIDSLVVCRGSSLGPCYVGSRVARPIEAAGPDSPLAQLYAFKPTTQRARQPGSSRRRGTHPG